MQKIDIALKLMNSCICSRQLPADEELSKKQKNLKLQDNVIEPAGENMMSMQGFLPNEDEELVQSPDGSAMYIVFSVSIYRFLSFTFHYSGTISNNAFFH